MSAPSRAASILRHLVLALFGLAVLAAVGYGVLRWWGGGDRGVRYRTEKVNRGRLASIIAASGTVVPEEVVDVGAQVAGKIYEFGKDADGKPIDYRSRVTTGMVLAKIDQSLYEPELRIARADSDLAVAEEKRSAADLDAARVRATQAMRDLDRARKLSTSGGLAAADYELAQQNYQTTQAAVPAAAATLDKAKASVKRAAAAADKAKTNLDYTEIVSPVDGVIIDRRVNIGQTVVASLNAPSLFLIAKDLKRLQVWASVNEADIGRIHVGQETAFKVDAYPERVFGGTVAQIRLNASMTQNVVTYTVVVTVDNSDLKLLPYLTANLQFKAAARSNVLKVPNAALRYRPPTDRIDPEYVEEYLGLRSKRTTVAEMTPGPATVDNAGLVWIDTGAYLRPVRVRTGLTDGTYTEVIEGELGEGDAVVVGEQSAATAGGGNPFAVKMWGGKKKSD